MEKGAKNGNFLKFLGKARRPCIYREEMRGFADQKEESARQMAARERTRWRACEGSRWLASQVNTGRAGGGLGLAEPSVRGGCDARCQLLG